MPTPTLSDRVRSLLASPHLVWLILLAALILGLPTLDLPLFSDDFNQYAFLHGQHVGTNDAPWWEMFAIVEGPPERIIGMRAVGRYPWWTDAELRIAFFRPITVLTHHLDHRLWPTSIRAMHMHSVVWHVIVGALAWALARRLAINPRVANLAALIYVLAPSHLIPVAWLAQRNGLVSTAFGLACLLAHDHWRARGSKPAAVLALLALALALGSAEAGVVTLGFLAAYELAYAEGPLARRALVLLPSLAIVIAWRLLYNSLGYGATASGIYTDPVGDPQAFLVQLPERLGWLWALSISPPFTAHMVMPWFWWTLTLVVAALLGWFLLRHASKAARFGCLAAALGCIPLTAATPFDRVLIMTSFGVALALAELIDRWLIAPEHTRPQALGAALVATVHLLLSPATTFVFATRIDDFGEQLTLWGPTLPNEGLGKRGLVIVHAPNFYAGAGLPAARLEHGLARPNFTWVLYCGEQAPTLRRIDERTIELSSEAGWPPPDEMWRGASKSPFRVGETVKTIDYVATIADVADDGRATKVEFRFRTKLEHPSFLWATFTGAEFEQVDPASFD